MPRAAFASASCGPPRGARRAATPAASASAPAPRRWRPRRPARAAGSAAPAPATASPRAPAPASAAAAAAAAAGVALLPASPAHAVSAATALVGPLFEPLVSASEFWVRALVWGDFRVAVALFVVYPLVLFFWSFDRDAAESDAIKRVMVGYWQASSLLMLTVFLNIANVPAAAFTGLFVQGMIPCTLLWWTDLLEEIEGDEGLLARAFRLWRWPAIVASAVGVVVQLPFQGCNLVSDVASDSFCAPWLEPPHAFHDLLIPGVGAETLQGIAYAGISIYATYLLWLVSNVLPTCGRSGRKDRNTFSSVSVLKYFGLIDTDSPGN